MKEGGGRKGETVLGDRGPTEDSITDGVLVLFPDALLVAGTGQTEFKNNSQHMLSAACEAMREGRHHRDDQRRQQRNGRQVTEGSWWFAGTFS